MDGVGRVRKWGGDKLNLEEALLLPVILSATHEVHFGAWEESGNFLCFDAFKSWDPWCIQDRKRFGRNYRESTSYGAHKKRRDTCWERDHFPFYTVSLIIPWKPLDSPGTQPPFSSAVVNRSFLGEGGLASLPGVIFSVLDFCPHLIIRCHLETRLSPYARSVLYNTSLRLNTCSEGCFVFYSTSFLCSLYESNINFGGSLYTCIY